MLLFRGNKANHGLIRAFTGGHFDHAALAIKDASDPKNDVTFLEAVGDAGVTSNSWQRIRPHIGPGKFFEKICIRKLNCKRAPEFYKTLDVFIDEVWAHNYGLFDHKKLKRESIALTDKNKRFVDEKRTFFCSELVVKAYKSLRVFNTIKASSHWMPSALAKDDLPLANDCSLSKPIHILIN
jgi:hypothetical protein